MAEVVVSAIGLVVLAWLGLIGGVVVVLVLRKWRNNG
jgi:hypothetical protein